jgi:hypothetical protein
MSSVRDLILTVFPVRSLSPERPSKRCGHSLSIVQNSAYLFGGASSEFIQGDFYSVDLLGQFNWKHVHLDGFHVPGCLFGHSSVSYRNRIILFGGLAQVLTFEFKNAPDTFGTDEEETPKSLNNEPQSAVNSFFFGENNKYDTSSFKDRLFSKPKEQECSKELFVFDCCKLKKFV